MSIATKITHKAEAVKAGARKRAGRATGGRRQRAGGRAGQAMANIKQAGTKIKDAFRH
jgi:uncharacterized protein YjbJ (UPF0337 family)